MDAARIRAALARMTPAERDRALALAQAVRRIWRPLPGPQTMAFESRADIIGFGGAAGGGKTDLACGMALTTHTKTAIFRREGSQMSGIVDRLKELVGHSNGYVGSGRWWGWRDPVQGKQIEFGSVPNPGDETAHQGRPKDLLVLDEASNFLEQQARFLMGWVRTTDPDQHCQTLMTFNPPTNADGRWILDFFAPWLDPKHPNPAKPGELRWFATIDGADVEVPDGCPFMQGDELVTPLSRTFIPSRITDNPHLVGTGYMAQLQAMPEPLRSQMLYGDFQAGIQDDAMQVIPTAWVEAAQARWRPLERKPGMDSLGVDVARGGRDNTVIARRHGQWYDVPLVYPGTDTPNGPAVAGLVVAAARDQAPIHLDVIGVGASPYDFLVEAQQPVFGVNVSEAARGSDKSGRLQFFNLRSELWWRMRELLDPEGNSGIALPADKRLLADLCAPKWSMRGAKVYVESRDEIVKRIGRSPDWASAYLLAAMESPRIGMLKRQPSALRYDPFAQLDERSHSAKPRDYDPLTFHR